MSTNPGEILEREFKKFLEKAPKMAGRYAVSHFQDNILKRSGIPVNGTLNAFAPRKYTTAADRGRRLLIRSGNMVDAIRITNYTSTSVTVGISQPDIARYGNLHNKGGEITVTPKMKKFFWAMYFKSAGAKSKRLDMGGGKYWTVTSADSKQQMARRAASKTEKNVQLTSDAAFYKAMALKKPGSKIRIPKREFMRFTPDVEKGILREFAYELKKIRETIKHS